MKIGAIILKHRKNAGLTRDNLAEKLHRSTMTIYKWENDITEPKASELIDIAKSLNISVTALFQENFIPEEVLKNPNIVLASLFILRKRKKISLEDIMIPALGIRDELK
jgi:transcriptional regulator with XRE-family HTH domain